MLGVIYKTSPSNTAKRWVTTTEKRKGNDECLDLSLKSEISVAGFPPLRVNYSPFGFLKPGGNKGILLRINKGNSSGIRSFFPMRIRGNLNV